MQCSAGMQGNPPLQVSPESCDPSVGACKCNVAITGNLTLAPLMLLGVGTKSLILDFQMPAGTLEQYMHIRICYMTLIGVHKMHGQVDPNQCHVTNL